MITYKIIWKPDDLSPYKKDWELIYSQGKNEPSTSFSWTHSLFCNHLRNQDNFFIIQYFKENKTICFVPMIATTEKLSGMDLVTIYFASERYNTHSDILAIDKSNELISSLLSSLNDIPIKWDIFRTTRILEQSQYTNSIEKKIIEVYPFNTIRHEQPSFFLKLPDTFNEYLNNRSGKFRNYLRRMEKKLSKLGEVKYIELNNKNNFKTAFNAIVSIESESWKQSHGTAISAIERQKNFYAQLCLEEYKTNRIHLSFLYIEDQPIAYNMGIVSHGTYYYLKTSYIGKFRNSSPSTVLRAKLISSLISENIRYFDFPGEPYEWEQQWTSELRWHKSIVVFNNTIKAKLLYYLSILRTKLKNKSNEKVLNFCNPKDLKSPTH